MGNSDNLTAVGWSWAVTPTVYPPTSLINIVTATWIFLILHTTRYLYKTTGSFISRTIHNGYKKKHISFILAIKTTASISSTHFRIWLATWDPLWHPEPRAPVFDKFLSCLHLLEHLCVLQVFRSVSSA